MDETLRGIVQLFDLPGAEGDEDAEPDKKGRTATESERLADASFKEGQYLHAIQHFKDALAQGSQSATQGLAAAFEAADMLPQAYHQFLKAAKSTQSGDLHAAIGDLYRRYGRLSDAIHELEEAAKLEPQNAYIHYRLAELLRKAGYPKAAKPAILAAVAAKPDDPFYHYWLADLLIELHDFSEAAKAAQAAVELSPGDDHLLQVAAVALWGTGKRPEAVRAARLANDLAEHNLANVVLLSALLYHSGQAEEASQESARLRQADEYDYDHVGRLLAHVGIQLDFKATKPGLA